MGLCRKWHTCTQHWTHQFDPARMVSRSWPYDFYSATKRAIFIMRVSRRNLVLWSVCPLTNDIVRSRVREIKNFTAELFSLYYTLITTPVVGCRPNGFLDAQCIVICLFCLHTIWNYIIIHNNKLSGKIISEKNITTLIVCELYWINCTNTFNTYFRNKNSNLFNQLLTIIKICRGRYFVVRVLKNLNILPESLRSLLELELSVWVNVYLDFVITICFLAI